MIDSSELALDVSGKAPNRGINFWLAVWLSIAIHLAILGPFFWYLDMAKRVMDKPPLTITLANIIPQQPPKAELPPPKQEPPKPKPKPKQLPKPAPKPQLKPKPAVVSKVVEKIEPAKEEAAPEVADSEPLARQTAVNQLTMQNILQSYARELVRKIQNNLRYPEEVKAQGYLGSVIIAMTLSADGQIVANSLSVAVSSGYQKLDNSALEAARISAPYGFTPTKKTMTIKVKIKFTERMF